MDGITAQIAVQGNIGHHNPGVQPLNVQHTQIIIITANIPTKALDLPYIGHVAKTQAYDDAVKRVCSDSQGNSGNLSRGIKTKPYWHHAQISNLKPVPASYLHQSNAVRGRRGGVWHNIW